MSATVDEVDLLRILVENCVTVLGVAGGAILLTDDAGELRVAASTSGAVRDVETTQLDSGAGPCVESVRRGELLVVCNVDSGDGTWPEFRAAALRHDFSAVFAMPLRLDGEIVGAVTLFWLSPSAPTERDVQVVQALSEVAIEGLLRDRRLRHSQLLNEQLQHALESRVIIEQAKGVVFAVGSLTMDDAFSALRTFARSHGITLREVATLVTSHSNADLISQFITQSQRVDTRSRTTRT